MLEKIDVKLLTETAVPPKRTHPTDAGLDIFSDQDIFIPHGKTSVVPTGVAMRVPEGMVGKIEDRSSMGKRGLRTGGGVVDSAFTGELSIILHNFSNRDDSTEKAGFGYQVKKGDKIAQMLVYPIATPSVNIVKELWTSDRGSKGFGSSGR